MGTQFTEIYEQSELIRNDDRLNGKSANNLYKLYFDYLKFAIGFFQADCNQNISQYTPFLQQEYHYITNGTDNIFSLSPIPPSSCLFYIGKSSLNDGNYVEITPDNYTYDSVNQTITIKGDILTINQSIYISGYIIGSFSVILNQMEQMILSEAMLIPWDQEHIHKNSLLNHLIYGGESQPSGTQANQISAVSKVFNSQYDDVVKSMINDYTYKYSVDNLKGLGGY